MAKSETLSQDEIQVLSGLQQAYAILDSTRDGRRVVIDKFSTRILAELYEACDCDEDTLDGYLERILEEVTDDPDNLSLNEAARAALDDWESFTHQDHRDWMWNEYDQNR